MQGNPTPTPESIGAQPVNDLLSSLGLLVSNGILEKTGTGTASVTQIGPTGRNLLAAADQATARGAMGLGSAATAVVESGTWTPVYVLGGGSASTNLAGGVWWRLNDLIFFTATLRTASVSAPTGDVGVSLPFPPLTITGGWGVTIGAPSVWATAMNLTGLIVDSTGVLLFKNATNTSPARVQGSDLATAANSNILRYSGIYVRAS